jgi:hypothetical protein
MIGPPPGSGHIVKTRTRLAREQRLAGGRVIQHRDRHAPVPLPRYAPLGARRHHGGQLRGALRGHECDLSQRASRLLGKSVEAAKPLFARALNDRFLGAPVDRVPVRERRVLPQRAAAFQCLHHMQIPIAEHLKFDMCTLSESQSRQIHSYSTNATNNDKDKCPRRNAQSMVGTESEKQF